MSEERTTLRKLTVNDSNDAYFRQCLLGSEPLHPQTIPAGGVAELTAVLRVENMGAGNLPTERYKAAERKIFARIAAARDEFFALDQFAVWREILAKAEKIGRELAALKRQSDRLKQEAVNAIVEGKDSRPYERQAREMAERSESLAAAAVELPKQAEREQSAMLDALKRTLAQERAECHAEALQRLADALAALPPGLGELLTEIWVAQELVELTRPKRITEVLTPDPLGSEIERLGRALPNGYDGRPAKQPSPFDLKDDYSVIPRDFSTRGANPSPQTVADALGTVYTRDSSQTPAASIPVFRGSPPPGWN